MQFRSVPRAFRRGHLRMFPIEKPEEGQDINEMEHALFRLSKRGRWVLYSN